MAFKPIPFRPPRRPFSLLNGSVDPASSEFRSTLTRMEPLLSKLDAILAAFREGGGARAVAQQTLRNKKLLARERLTRLTDKGEFTEIFRLAGYEQPYGSIPAASSVNAIGKISGRLCLMNANDATVKGGTVYPISTQKQLRQQALSQLCRLPMVYIVDSGGAFLPLQADIFPDKHHGGRIFYNEAVMEANGIHQLSIVCGPCTAGGAYVPMMCEETTMVTRIGHVFLGGPLLVKAALGEIVTSEDLGGATLHSSVSGCSDHFASDEDEAFAQLRAMAASLPQQQLVGANLEAPRQPLFPSRQLDGLGPNLKENATPELSRQILARVVDGSLFFEFKAAFGKSLTAGFGRIAGRLIGVLASSGPLTAEDGLKGSHFVQLCQQRSAPLLLLCHTTDDIPASTDSAETSALALRAKANFIGSLATFPLPKIAVVTGDAVGWDATMMGSRALSPTFIFAWPNARFGLTSDVTTDAFRAAGDLRVDDVIKPSETRFWLETALAACHMRAMGDPDLQSRSKSTLRF